MKYVIEPMLFAFDHKMAEEELAGCLNELLVLDKWWTAHKTDMYLQDSTSEVLYMNNYFPTCDALKPLLEKHHVDFIQPGDVEKIIVKMLSKSKSIESLYDEPMLELKKQSMAEPLNVSAGVRRSKELENELFLLFWHIFLAHKMGGYDEESFVIITKGVSEIVHLKYEYEEIDANYELKERKADSKVSCKGSLVDYLNDRATPFLLWKTAEQKEDLDLGVRVELLQRERKLDLEYIYVQYDFAIQNSFFEDYQNGHYRSKYKDIKSAIQAVTDAVMEQNLRHVHAIRTGKNGNDPQLKVHGYCAERRNITTSIKLAYWKKGREYKIANMREHDFFEPTWEM